MRWITEPYRAAEAWHAAAIGLFQHSTWAPATL